MSKEIADLLFPDVVHDRAYYEEMYAKRDLPEGAQVTRFAPSPTGFVHIGSLYAALVAERVAHTTGGVFMLRIEDTDKKREVEGGIEQIVSVLNEFGIEFDEGPLGENNTDIGEYGPYIQSHRRDIYRTFAKSLVEKDMAYPCFCTPEQLDMTRKRQEATKQRTGYYGQWATDRNLSDEEIKEKLNQGMSFVVRLRSPGVNNRKIVHKDLIKGKVEFPENDIDHVIIKSDGIPTYHFAHAVDDTLMRTTLVTRGDEWLSSVPVHLQMFAMLGVKPPKFAHISPILKKEGEGKRKISKRKDAEAAVQYYFDEGYPNDAVTEYLLNIANSSFEPWRRSNPTKHYEEFQIKLGDMSVSGALFDLVKLTDISKDVISKMTAEQVYDLALEWANIHDEELKNILEKDKDLAIRIFNIERNGKKPRKDIAKWGDVKHEIAYFYDELFDGNYDYDDKIDEATRKEVLAEYAKVYSYNDDKDTWFNKIKEVTENLGFASNMKEYKLNPENYKGNVSDISNIIRVALTGRRMSPDMYEIMQIMGEEKVKELLTK